VSFTALKNNEVTKALLTNSYTRPSASFIRVLVVGRADQLSTPVNLQVWFGNHEVNRGDHGHQIEGRRILND
jgi:hypothetical protein